MAHLTTLIKNLPNTPGIYKMLDNEGRVIYVGKANDLKKRVQTYFRKDYEHSTRTRKLVSAIADIETIRTDTELEAVILENTIVKELRPKYNILMKDDKSYVYIKVDLSEDFPRIRVIREREMMKEGKKKNVKYLGPKLASSKVYETLKILKTLFPYRHCNLDILWKGTPQKTQENLLIPADKNLVEVTNRVIDFPCLDYYIKRCPGPCIGATSPIEYKKVVHQILDFLNGKTEEIEASLKTQMQEAAQAKLFEKAARIRDKLFAVQAVTERQKVSDPDRKDTDVIHFATDSSHVYFNIMLIRGGKLVTQENFVLDALELEGKSEDAAEITESFIKQYYEKTEDIPKEILIPHELAESHGLQEWLTHKRGSAVHILSPERGVKNHLLELSLKNATSFAKQYRIKWMSNQNGAQALADLAQALGMKDKKLARIEGYDISHLGGNETVGSMVVFENGFPKSSDYRHFKLRTVQGKPDDYRSMEEVLMRRLKYLTQEKSDAELQIRTPAKKDFEEIKNIIEKEHISGEQLNPKDFAVMKRQKKIVGFARIRKLNEKISCLASLWIDHEERGKRLGYKILSKLIRKSKLKRVYLDTQKKFEDYFSEFGFTVLHEIPEVLKQAPKIEPLFMVYNVSKHKLDPSFSAHPDLLVIDGGKGQLSTALLCLKRLKLEIPVISLAKRLEEIFIPGQKAPLLLEEGEEALKLLQRIRDESHRFAITFQRELHRKALIHGELSTVI